MSERFRSMMSQRGLILVSAVLLSLPLAVGAYAASGHSSSKKTSATVKTAETDDQNDDQGETETETDASTADTTVRFHGDGTTSCDLPAGVEALSGNWTHGDYVSAWARWANQQKQQGLSAASTGSQVNTAAESDCGKPLSSVESHGKSGESHGKSAEAHTHRAAHQP